MTTTFIGSGTAGSDGLAAALDVAVDLTAPTSPGAADRPWDAGREVLDAWRARLDAVEPAVGMVVCTWPEPTDPVPLDDVDPAAWRLALEWPTALWFTTLVAAAERCLDGGSLVVVVERPATLDAGGRAPAVAVADGLVNLVRSLAATHGPRRVRVNAVISQLQSPSGPLPGAPPPLASFPGRAEVEVAGAVRLLLSDDARGVTGTVLDAGCGR